MLYASAATPARLQTGQVLAKNASAHAIRQIDWPMREQPRVGKDRLIAPAPFSSIFLKVLSDLAQFASPFMHAICADIRKRSSATAQEE